MVKVREPYPLSTDGNIDISKWLERLSIPRDPKQLPLIDAACDLVLMKGKNLVTAFGEGCLQQGLAMAEILQRLGADTATIAAAIVFDTFEVGVLTTNELETSLNIEVANLVGGVAQLRALQKKQVQNQEYNTVSLDKLRRMLLAVVEDLRVVLLRLAQHTCDMRSAVHCPEEVRRQLAEETRAIYGPLANRLGIGHIKWELEDLSFRFLEPVAYKTIAGLLDEKRMDREVYIREVIAELEGCLKEAGIVAKVTGRVKHIFSIWKKMQRKSVGYHEIYDVRALRVLVPELKDCYGALGVIHTQWQHIPKEFDDYIANPKTNGYRSLHTAVVGPAGKTLEVQIRTDAMHEESELGVAAHWHYKEGGALDTIYQKKLASVRQWLQWQNEFSGGEQDAQAALCDVVCEDRVYVLTPKGRVIDLPLGSTALDFAYHVHTELGHRCRGAKIDGRIMALNYELKNGQQIEILPAKEGSPSRDWLNQQLGYLKTARARSKVSTWFKKRAREQNIYEGRSIFEKELKRLCIENLSWDTLVHKLNFSKIDDCLVALGSGELRVSVLLHAIQQIAEPLPATVDILPIFKPAKQDASHTSDIQVAGLGNLLCQRALCCKPLPGEDIVGFITVGRGVKVHRKDCENILQKSEITEGRFLEVNWGQAVLNPYAVEINVEAFDRQGLLRDVTQVLSAAKINVIAVNTLSHKGSNTADLKLNIEVASLASLSEVLARIQQLPNVIEAYRLKPH